MKQLVIIAFLATSGLLAQKTLQLNKNNSPNATLDDVSWIAGHWKGNGLGGVTEEIWSPPLGDSMMFVFRLVNDGKVVFYESGHIKQLDTTLILQLKHFDGDLKGWETKDETIDFKLVKLEKDKVFFEGLTMVHIDDNTLHIYVLIGNEGEEEEVLFQFKRAAL